MSRLTWDGVGSSGLGPADLTDGGASDRFLIDFSQVHVSTDCAFAAAFQILIFDGTGNSLVSDYVLVDAAGLDTAPGRGTRLCVDLPLAGIQAGGESS